MGVTKVNPSGKSCSHLKFEGLLQSSLVFVAQEGILRGGVSHRQGRPLGVEGVVEDARRGVSVGVEVVVKRTALRAVGGAGARPGKGAGRKV